MSASNELRRSSALDALTKDNYKTWRMQAEALLRVNRLWDYVEEEEELILTLDERKLWMKMEKLAKSELILGISSSLLPLVENCTTAREVWLKLADVYGNKSAERENSIENSDTDDEDVIISEIESCVDDFFETINNSSVQNISEMKKSLITKFTHRLFSRLKTNCVKELPDEKNVVLTIGDFIDDIQKLPKIRIKELTNDFSSELIDVLLSEFNIDPNKNDDNEAISSADEVETRDNVVDHGGVKKEKNRELSELLSFLSRQISSDAPGTYDELLESEIESDYESIPCDQLYDQQEDCRIETSSALMNLCTPPSTPTRNPRKCGICREEGHNRTTCPLNNSAASASRSIATRSDSLMNPCTSESTPTRQLRKCGICREEGHNRTTCPLKNSAASASRSIATRSDSLMNLCTSGSTPTRKPRKCGICREEGHNRTTCPLNNSAASASRSTATRSDSLINLCTSRSTPTEKSRKCGICRIEGHNRRTCPLNKPAVSAPKYYTVQAPEGPRGSYQCGGCGNEGHNIRSCPSMRSDISSPKPAAVKTPARSYRCGSCGQEGHNSRTCGSRGISSSSYSTPSRSYSSYSTPAPKRSAYRCGNCGGTGHNRRTCSG